MYWQSPKPGAEASETLQSLIKVSLKSTEPSINKLREAAAARKLGTKGRRSSGQNSSKLIYDNEYWIPSAHALPASAGSFSSKTSLKTSHTNKIKEMDKEDYKVAENKEERNPIISVIPLTIGTIAAVIVSFHLGKPTVGVLNDHVGGSLALEVVNSSGLQIALAGVMWYLLGMAAVELTEAIQKRLY